MRFSRSSRSITSHMHWKASELRNWLLFYSLPLLHGFLPPLYLHHFALLVCAMHILLQGKIALSHIDAAELMLNEFYVMMPELYGESSCTPNVHSLYVSPNNVCETDGPTMGILSILYGKQEWTAEASLPR